MNSLFKNSWKLYREKFWTIVSIVAVSLIPIILGISTVFGLFFKELLVIANTGNLSYVPYYLSTIPEGVILGTIGIIFLIDLFFTGALLGAIVNNIKPRKAFGIATRNFFRFLWLTIIELIIILIIPVTIGIVLPLLGISESITGGLVIATLIFPGILFSVWFSMAPYALFKDSLGGLKALKKSKELVSKRFKSVFWRLFVLGTFMMMVSSFVTSTLNLPLLSMILAPFGLIFMLSIYKSLGSVEPTERSADNEVFEAQKTEKI